MAFQDRIKSLKRVQAKDLLRNPRNYRTHPPEQSAALRGVLSEIGFAGAVIARETSRGLELIDGHLRADISPESKIPVLVLDVTKKEADKLLAVFDPLAAMAGVDQESLAALLDGLKFDDAAAQALLDDLGFDVADQESEILEPATPEPPSEPVTTAGDVITLGKHRLICGDCRRPEDVARLMNGKKADMLLTDPPYGMNLDTDWSTNADSGGCQGSKKSIRMKKRRLGQEKPGRAEWDASVFDIGVNGNKYAPVIGDDEPFDPAHLFEFFSKAREVFLWGADYYAKEIPTGGSWLVWDKRKESQADGIGSEFELCWSSKKHKRRVLRHDWFGFLSSGNAKDAQNRRHPTQKPVTLFVDMLKQWGKETDLIVDPYLGSGTTLIAAEQLGRSCYGMEIDAGYCDVIVDRWETMTNGKAKRKTESKPVRVS